MNIEKWLASFVQYLIVVPSVVSCYFAAKNQMKYTYLKTAVLCGAVLIPFLIIGPLVCTLTGININFMLMVLLVLFFFLFRFTVICDLPRTLAIYVGVCAVQAFSTHFAYAFDAILHPESGALHFSAEAAFFQLGISCLIMVAFGIPSRKYSSWAVDQLDSPKIWYSTLVLSSIFLIFNMACIPLSYSTLNTGRLIYLYPLLELCALAVLTAIYILFYFNAKIILEHARLKEHSQLLEIQSHQYMALQEHINQTSKLRHDFRHSLYLLSALAENGDISGIRTHLAEYEIRLTDNIHINYCSNYALNALFGYYHETAAESRIKTDWNIELPEPLTASELDMAGMFGNLMENAIAGCLTVPEEKRYFCLTTEIRQKSMLYIVSTNSFDGKVRKGKDGYLSTKHSGNGIGLASITAVAEKYNGSAQIYNSEKEFFVDIVLQI